MELKPNGQSLALLAGYMIFVVNLKKNQFVLKLRGPEERQMKGKKKALFFVKGKRALQKKGSFASIRK
jgi:kynureninase